MALDLGGDLLSLFQRIVDVESVSGNETRLADMVASALADLPHLEVERDGDCVVARTHLSRGMRVVIAGHLDTVPLADNLPSRLEERDDGLHLVGRGTVDMKGGVAVALALAAELTQPIHDITWIFYDHEEVEAARNGLGRLARNRPDLMAGDFAILMEPTGGEVEGGCQGTARIRIDLEGRAAHSARSWKGINAVHKLEEILRRLNAWEPRHVAVDGLVYREGLNAISVSGGVAGNVVPPSASIGINYRFAPDKTPEDALAELRRIFEGYHFEVTDMSPAARPGLDLPVAAEFIAAVGAVPLPKYGWTDVARFSAMGVPAINYGPGDALLAHTDLVHCPISDLERCADGLRRWLKEN